MHTTKPMSNAQIALTSGTTAPWMALFALSTLPLFAVQLSMAATLQIVVLLSGAMVALAHFADAKNYETAHFAIKLVAPLQFALMIWLSVTLGRDIGGASFAASYIASIVCLLFIILGDALASAALALVAGYYRAVAGAPMAMLISAKYAGLAGEMK
jgi:hypothetical protein